MTKCWPNLLKNLVLFLCCIILCLYEFSHITIKTIQGDSFQSINELHFKELYAPVMSCTSLEKTCPIYQFLYWIPKCHFFLGRNISPWDFEDLEKQKSISYLGNLFFLLWIVFHYAKTAVFIPPWVLKTEEKIETCFFDFDTALIAFGGTLGLYLGWSIHSIFVNFIDMTVKHQSKVSSWCK